jgi:septal ring factor EnvC (AmiA/AmiB activator)
LPLRNDIRVSDMSCLLNPIFALLVLATCLLADDTSLLHSPTIHHASAHGVEKATKQIEGQPAVESKASEAPTEAQLSKLEREMVKVEAKFTEYKKSAKAERADLEKLMPWLTRASVN